jgi:hypothetical protein
MYMKTMGRTAIIILKVKATKGKLMVRREFASHVSLFRDAAREAHHGIEDDGANTPLRRRLEEGNLGTRGHQDAFGFRVRQLLRRQRYKRGGRRRPQRLDQTARSIAGAQAPSQNVGEAIW